MIRRNLALGAAGIALGAGAVATGMALVNKNTRKRLTKGARRAFATYQTVAHRISTVGMRKGKKSKGKKLRS